MICWFKNFEKISYRLYSSTQNLRIINIFRSNYVGEKIQIKGWIKASRKMKQHLFLDVNDGSCSKNLQVIATTANASSLTSGSSIIATGVLQHSPKNEFELNSEHIELCGGCNIQDGYPFAPRKVYSTDYVRQYLHFRPRTSHFSSLLRIRDAATRAIHNFFHKEGYLHVHTPILTSNDCEGAGETFAVVPNNQETLKNMVRSHLLPEEAYFNSKTFLTVSAQLHLEAVVHGLSKVYTLGPTFRAENSKSRLHLSEFYMLEAECAFINGLDDVLVLIEKLVKNVTTDVLNECEDDLKKSSEGGDNFAWLDKKFVVLTYDGAAAILKDKTKYPGDFVEGASLNKDHEKFLVEYCGGIPTFVINWPKDLKPFYMKECVEDESRVAALDLLVSNVGELVGGSLRENCRNKLEAKLPRDGVELDWYLDLRKFGGTPSGGFGLGFERYLQFILGINNIKDVIPFPRWPHNCKL
uniref:asparagine--tRNA ligase n=3 Tax=Photinus pyralis TaxID=7054 RepID=A0A1Y1LFX4_PHOPY